MAGKYTLRLEHHFDAAHKLRLDHASPCQNVHGHRWDVVIEIVSNRLDKCGMVCDFKVIKGFVNELDHKMLNEVVDFNPTAENISKYLHDKIKREVVGEVKVTIFESPGASITYEDTETEEDTDL